MNEKFTSITPKVPEGNKAGTPLQEHLRNNPPVPKPEIAAEELANEVRDRIQKMQE